MMPGGYPPRIFMTDSPPGAVTLWLQRWRDGERDALEHVVPLVYDELRRAARRQISRESPANTLSATALVHEVYLRLLQRRQIVGGDRHAFLAVATQTMRRILVEHARRRKRLKRGGDQVVGPLADGDEVALVPDGEVDELLALDAALGELARLDERAARVVEYRIFAGLTLEETAQALDLSTKTVQRAWTTALAWLRKEIAGGLAR
jgi:RNA polymerase sigma-70 factor, ECF subfamily